MADLGLKEKAQPDTGALSVGEFAVQASQKVQLDIDDAPFLSALEEEALPVPVEDRMPALQDSEENVPQKFWQKKKFRISVAGGLLLLFVAVGVYYYFFFLPPPVVEVKVEPTVIVVPSQEQIEGPPGFNVAFKPFMVEQRTGNTVRFLNTRFTTVTKDEAVSAEARSKMLALRDAVYYYLRNKSHEYLIDPANSLTIKRDLTDILNGYLVKGKVDDVLLESYVVK